MKKNLKIVLLIIVLWIVSLGSILLVISKLVDYKIEKIYGTVETNVCSTEKHDYKLMTVTTKPGYTYDEEIYNCSECEFVGTSEEFEEHLKNISVEEQSKHQKEDSRAFTTIQVEPETETAYYCTICGKKRTQN